MSKLVNEVNRRLEEGIENWGGVTSPDFKDFAKVFGKMIREQLKQIGGTDYKQNTGHYYISGFFTVGEQVYYISISDVRHFPDDKMLIRTAKDYKDFTGGTNNYLTIRDGMFEDLECRIS